MAAEDSIQFKKAQIARLQEEIRRLETMPVEPENGTIIQLDIDGEVEDYYIRVKGEWFNIGPLNVYSQSWTELCQRGDILKATFVPIPSGPKP